ncbi:amino acid transporter [Cytobacillus suaedae]|nr:amino acid transporter [Cytobacillus suaedae]
MVEALLHGIILAFGLIIPLGVQNVFVFNQGASGRNFYYALPAVITAGVCDTILILLAVVGVSVLVLTFAWFKFLLFTVGIVFLLYMGYTIWNSDPRPRDDIQGSLSVRRQIAFAASVSLLNPHAILDTIGVIGTNSLQYEDTEKVIFTVACITVSWLWFIGLAAAGRYVGKIDKDGSWLRKINKLSAIIIWGVALYLLIQLIGS